MFYCMFHVLGNMILQPEQTAGFVFLCVMQIWEGWLADSEPTFQVSLDSSFIRARLLTIWYP